MRYALLIHYPQPAVPTVSQDEIKAGMAAFQAYAKALEDAGVLQSAEVLQTIANATSISVKQGETVVPADQIKLGGSTGVATANPVELTKA